MRYCLAILLLLLCCPAAMARHRHHKTSDKTAPPAPAPEPVPYDRSDRIARFESWVVVRPEGALDVTEEITVYNRNGNDQITHGILRNFPTKYVNEQKLFQNTTFELKEVLLNGTPVRYMQEGTFGRNGYTLKIGDPLRLLDTGFSTYTIRYHTQHQVKFLKDYDELAWNVTGNGWAFYIDSAICHMVIAGSDSAYSSACYTGPQGYNTGLCRFSGQRDTILFHSTQALKPGEGLTVATSWEKGIIAPPTAAQRWWWLLKNNIGALGMPLLWLVILCYNLFKWWRHGRDLRPGTIIVQYGPPEGFSPAALGYIYFQRMRNRLLAAAITDLALRNAYRIEVRRTGMVFKENEYIFRPASQDFIPAGYEDFREEARELMGTIVSKGTYNETLDGLKKQVRQKLDAAYEGRTSRNKTAYFIRNARFLLFGYFLSVLLFIPLMILVLADADLNFWPLVPLVGGFILCILTQMIFARLMPNYTPEGRALMDKIEGYRRYLKTVDENRLNLTNPPEKTIDLFEKNLAFAIALDCDIEWGRKFEQVIKTAIQQGATHPGLFYGNSFASGNAFSASSFISGFSGAISSASTPPSSSSGGGSSFGGGSSGSGGGGGGGGGW
ncbi:DUF2207 domain-containing protein [Taibaiella koreensis]|uniref:DUF2207 domain-containing protein n=1 Tax=Taibaiella koreensis TaxID=1268548 RepID=UPI000E59DE3D|nr:DUF2207 domain-containing protein [Taibaiella koreensis]